MYAPGDYVYVADLPQRLLCRVAAADTARSSAGPFQILTLEPLEGPWRSWPETQLIRLDAAVRPARARDLWRRRLGRAGPGRPPDLAFSLERPPGSPWRKGLRHKGFRAVADAD
jgi:hypothetical protein